MDDKSRWRGRLSFWLLGTALLSGCQMPQAVTNTGAPPPAANGTWGTSRAAPQPPAANTGAVQPITAAAGSSMPQPSGVVQASYEQPVACQQPAACQQPVLCQQPPLGQQPMSGQPQVSGQQPTSGQPQAAMVTTAAYPPAPTPLLPPAVNVTPNPTLAPGYRNTASGPTVTFGDVGPANDVHQLPAPTVGGAILNMMPGDHPVERAAIATQQLHQEQMDKKNLEAREQQLKAELAQREKSIREATHEVKEATEEIHRTRTALQASLLEADEKLAALRKREQADAVTIKEILKKLDHGPEGSPTPMPTPAPMSGPDDHAPMRP